MREIKKMGKISVIIPTYNNEGFLPTCIDSILNQTYNDYEVIIVNDGSTDNSLDIAKKYEKEYSFIKIIDNENKGQGYSRNYALNFAQGEYILFLDSDDFLEPVTLEVAIKKITEDKSDFVVFDWKYYKTISGNYAYVNKDKFFSKKMLTDNECLQLLSIQHYFTVNKLYSKKFLLDNKIKYGEGYIYEDIEFWIKASVNAKRVSLIHSPLYNVRISKTSTTKTNYDTNYHCDSFIKSVHAVIDILGKENKEQYYYVYKYLIDKFFLYYYKRTPKKSRKKFLNEFVNAMTDTRLVNFNIPNKLVLFTYKLKIFEKKRKFTFKCLYLAYKIKKKLRVEIKKIRAKIKSMILTMTKKKPTKKTQEIMQADTQKKELQNNILFMGFDYRFTGNSRYLFEQLLSKGVENIYFATENEQLDKQYRVKPGSQEFYKIFYSAKIIIFETWIPLNLRKMPTSIWIQLWHGTPLKKMLYDSDEKEIITTNPNHKINKFKDISRWDYLLTDNEEVNQYFERAFLMPKDKILPLGYPRVEYLLDNKENLKLKKEIKQKANLPLDKKIVTYLPTWRDYNYGVSDENIKSEYFLNGDDLQSKLGEEYILVSKNHSYLNKNSKMTNTELETQELLLVSDFLITDYSSVMFDAFAIDLPVILFAKDYEEYIASRGVYQEMWSYMQNMICKKEDDVAEMIKNYHIDSNYEYLKENLSYKNTTGTRLCEKILDLELEN